MKKGHFLLVLFWSVSLFAEIPGIKTPSNLTVSNYYVYNPNLVRWLDQHGCFPSYNDWQQIDPSNNYVAGIWLTGTIPASGMDISVNLCPGTPGFTPDPNRICNIPIPSEPDYAPVTGVSAYWITGTLVGSFQSLSGDIYQMTQAPLTSRYGKFVAYASNAPGFIPNSDPDVLSVGPNLQGGNLVFHLNGAGKTIKNATVAVSVQMQYPGCMGW